MKVKTVSTHGPIDEVEEFIYWASVLGTTGGTDQDGDARLRKARSTFRTIDRLYVEVQDNNWKGNESKYIQFQCEGRLTSRI